MEILVVGVSYTPDKKLGIVVIQVKFMENVEECNGDFFISNK